MSGTYIKNEAFHLNLDLDRSSPMHQDESIVQVKDFSAHRLKLQQLSRTAPRILESMHLLMLSQRYNRLTDLYYKIP